LASPAPEPRADRDRRGVWVRRVLLAVILAGAFLARCRDAPHIFQGTRVLFPGYDTHYHMRRIQHAVADWPRVPAFDAWVNAPEGAAIYWPAGFDLLLATAARLLGAEPWTSEVERCCAWAMPFLGVALVAAAWWLGRVWRGPWTGLLAALIVAAAPMAISVSAVGRVDHDVAAVLSATLACTCCLKGLAAKDRAYGIAWGAASGLLLTAGLWIWPGAVVFVLLTAAFLVVHSLVEDRVPEAAVTAVLSAAVLTTALCALSASGQPMRMSHLFLSGFHVVLSWAGAAGLILLYMMFWACSRRRLRVAWGIACQAAVAACVVPWVLHGLRGAGSFVSATADVTVSTTGEGIGLFERGLDGVARDLSWLGLAAPAALGLLLCQAWAGRRRSGDGLVALWLLGSVGLAAGQRRFAAVAAVPIGLSVAALTAWAVGMTRRLAVERRWLLRLLLVGGALAALAWPTARWRERPYPPNWELRAVLPALEWLRDSAPSPGNARAFDERPAYSTIAFWHYGHWLTYLGGQANVACPFGNTGQHQAGLARSQAFFGARTEHEAEALCRRLRIRYVLSPELPVPLLVKQAGLDPRRLSEQRAMAVSLHLWRGLQAPDRAGPLRHFRLVGTFDGFWPGGRPYATHVFEYVPGARLAGKAPPGGQVRLEMDIADPAGRRLRYTDTAARAEDDTFVLVVPYATESGPGLYRAIGPARLTWGNGVQSLRAETAIPESAVFWGGTVTCDLH